MKTKKEIMVMDLQELREWFYNCSLEEASAKVWFLRSAIHDYKLTEKVKCPICKGDLRIRYHGVFLCTSQDCSIFHQEIYGGTQEQLTSHVKAVYPELYKNRIEYREWKK